jgi:hypothetical protein
MVPVTVSIVIGGVLYAIVLGAITGYFSAAVGMLFVVAGIVGIVAAAFNRKALAVFFLAVLVVVNVIALAVNVCGVVDPKFLTTMEARDLGFMTIKPSVLWFLGGLAFMAVFCIPCITIAVVNVCTFRARAPAEKASRFRLASNRPTAEEIVALAAAGSTNGSSIPTVKQVKKKRESAESRPSQLRRNPTAGKPRQSVTPGPR